MKRIVTIQDISCIGRCSLTVALPVISALGIECAVIPTAVLSNHTAFSGFTFCDLTDQITPIIDQWQREGLTFDAVYTGYLGSFEQIRIVSHIIDVLRAQNPALRVIVDPAMADFGKLYTGFDETFAREMTSLCKKADIVLPNLTEACYMLGIPYPEHGCSEDEYKAILYKLSALGCPTTVLTGVSLRENRIGAMSYDRESDTYFCYENEHLAAQFHGTGDIFASVVTGAVTRGMSVSRALTLAVDFTLACIRSTMADADHRWYGVNFESVLGQLTAASDAMQNEPVPGENHAN